MKELSERMVDFRAKNDLSQDDLASLCHLTRQTIANIENGITKGTKLTKAKIEKIIGKEE